MTHTKLLTLIAIGAGMLACSPSPLTAPSGGASVKLAIRVVPHPGSFNLKAAPGQDRLDHYTFTLKQGVATIQGPTNVAVAASPLAKTISNIATGNGYTIEVDGVDSNGASVTTGAASTAQFDVVGTNVYDTVGDPTHLTPLDTVTTPLAITLNMAAGALDPGPTVSVADTATVGDRAGISLLNLLNWKTASIGPTAVDAGGYDFAISDVAQGATGGNSHQLFYFFANSVAGQATVAKSQNVAGDAWGTIDTTTINLTHDMTNQTPTNEANNGGPARIRTGGGGHTYYYFTDGFSAWNFHSEDLATVIPVYAVAPITDPSIFAVVPINGNDRIYYFDPNDNFINYFEVGGAPAPANVVDLTGNFTAINDMAVDKSGAVYWLDAGNVYKLDDGETTFAQADPIVNSGLVTAIAVDAYGNLYYAENNKIYRSAFDGTNYGAGILKLTVDNFVVNGSLTSDAAGNLYFLDGAGTLEISPAVTGTSFQVVGSAGKFVVTPSVGFDGTLFYIDGSGGGDHGCTMKM